MLGRGGATEGADEADVFAASVLSETPQIANVLFTDVAGNFMLVRRAADGPAGADPQRGNRNRQFACAFGANAADRGGI
jgi:hypothetical protein